MDDDRDAELAYQSELARLDAEDAAKLKQWELHDQEMRELTPLWHGKAPPVWFRDAGPFPGYMLEPVRNPGPFERECTSAHTRAHTEAAHVQDVLVVLVALGLWEVASFIRKAIDDPPGKYVEYLRGLRILQTTHRERLDDAVLQDAASRLSSMGHNIPTKDSQGLNLAPSARIHALAEGLRRVLLLSPRDLYVEDGRIRYLPEADSTDFDKDRRWWERVWSDCFMGYAEIFQLLDQCPCHAIQEARNRGFAGPLNDHDISRKGGKRRRPRPPR